MSQSVVTTEKDGVLHVELNRPETLNAMDNELFAELAAAVMEGHDNADVRVILLSGRGAAFSAGANLKALRENPDMVGAGAGRWPGTQLMLTMTEVTKPVVAAVHGAAIGGGVTLLLSCDLVVAAEGTRFCMPFSQVGICTELGSSYLLPFYVGMRKAKEWALLGETFDAAEALEAGLVNAVAPADQLMERAARYVDRLRICAPRSLRATKRLMAAAHRAALANILLEEAEELRVGFRSEEAAEAIGAFSARRKPDFTRFR